jgi:uncharacterized membrane protein
MTFTRPVPDRPFAARVRQVSTDAPMQWLTAGWQDFKAAPMASLAYGMIFVVAGLVMLWALYAANLMYLFVPLATGFMLIGPAATLGFYAISRDLERGQQGSFTNAVLAFREHPSSLLYMGFALLCMEMLWMRLAELLFALTFPSVGGANFGSLVMVTFTTPGGLVFLFTSFGLGALMAALTFAGAAFALPLIYDRDISMVEAIATSWTAVEMNIQPMLRWAVMLAALTAVGMIAGIVGLAITLPLCGHATWHAYRAVIRPEGQA